jgi:hypothetical protein
MPAGHLWRKLLLVVGRERSILLKLNRLPEGTIVPHNSSSIAAVPLVTKKKSLRQRNDRGK